jgi:hypothetical protein
MTSTHFRHRLPGGRQPALQRQRGPLIVELVRPLRLPALMAFMLAAWPIVLPLLWLGLIGWLAWLTITRGRRARNTTLGAAARAAAPAPAPTPAPAPRRPANTITRTANRLPRR